MTARSQTILLVEDNQDDVELTVHAFRKSQMDNQIVVAHDGEEALDYLFRRTGDDAHELPAVMLLDLKLPGISGLDVLRRVRDADTTRRMPVVILTTSDDESDIINGYNLGVNSYIQKPVDFKAFTGVVDQLGLYWLKVNLPAPM
ncbi:MAG TPA: response regulator [Magnetospirillum sp.]|nr:response regulator [Magnetospirillum sp.]